MKALHVTSRNGVMPFKGKDVAPDSIAKALSVGTIVSGTVAQSGDKIRVTVDMLDARTGNSIGSTTIEKTKQDAFALQDTLVTEVSAVLRKQLGQQVQVLTSKAGTSNAAAWEAFQRAKQTVSQGDSLLGAGDVTGGDDAAGARRLGARRGRDAGRQVGGARRRSRRASSYRLARLAVAARRRRRPSSESDRRGARARGARRSPIAPNDPDALEARGSLRYLQWLLNLTPRRSPTRRWRRRRPIC